MPEGGSWGTRIVGGRSVVLAVLTLLTACGGSPLATPSAPPATVPPASAPHPPTSPSVLADPTGATFDGAGDLWVCNYRASTLVMYARADLVGRRMHASPSPIEPRVEISGLSGPNGIVFDRAGDLWAVEYGSDSVVAYTPSQLRTSGSPAPAIVVSSNGDALSAPTGLAFDRSGSLWVSNQRTGDVVAYRPAQIRRSAAPRPAVVLRMPDGANSQAVAFAPDGWLWVARYDADEVLGFSPAELGRTGSPPPAGRVQLEAVSGPIGLAVDRSGRLWVALNVGSEVEAFPRRGAAGVPRPVTRLTGHGLEEPHGVAFDAQGDAWITAHDDLVLRYPHAVAAGGVRTAPDLILS